MTNEQKARLTERVFKRLLEESKTTRKEKLQELKVGDVKKALGYMNKKKNKEAAIAAAKAAGAAGVEALIDAIPGFASAKTVAAGAKTMYDIYKAAQEVSPEDKKKNPLWDMLTIDPDTSAIVDDAVEQKFIQALGDKIKGMSDDDDLVDADEMLAAYLKGKYSGSHVAK